MDTVVAVIPARHWSQGTPGKNREAFDLVRDVGGVSIVKTIIITSDDPALLGLPEHYGLPTPIRMRVRPPHLEDGPMGPVIADALTGVDAGLVVVLQPSSPSRRRLEYIQGAIYALRHMPHATSVVSVVPWVYDPPEKAVRIDDKGYLVIPDAPARRQDCPPCYRRDGTVYAVRAEYARQGDLYGPRPLPLLVTPAHSVTID